MSGTQAPRIRRRRLGAQRGAEDDAQRAKEFVRLRQLLSSPVLTAESVAEVLPEAVTKSTETGLAVALEPPVTTILRRFARKEAALFGEILSPAIATAVTKAIADAIATMLQKFNEALERSMSLR